MKKGKQRKIGVNKPGVFLADLFFFGWCEVVFNVKGLANFVWSLSFDHIGNSLACNIQQTANVQVVGCQNQFKKSSLIDLVKNKMKVVANIISTRMTHTLRKSASQDVMSSVRFSLFSSSSVLDCTGSSL